MKSAGYRIVFPVRILVNEKGQANYPSVAKACTFPTAVYRVEDGCGPKQRRTERRGLRLLMRVFEEAVRQIVPFYSHCSDLCACFGHKDAENNRCEALRRGRQ